MENNKICVYTSITNNYDSLRTPHVIRSDVDYICFTDTREIEHDIWDVRYVPALDHKEPKMKPIKFLDDKYTHSIWIDANITLIVDPMILLEHIGRRSISVFSHPQRVCAYEEAKICGGSLSSRYLTDLQINYLKKMGYPINNGLSSCGVILRKHNIRMDNLGALWYSHIKEFTRRDQISFDYCLWKLKIKKDTIVGNIFNNPLVEVGGHGGA